MPIKPTTENNPESESIDCTAHGCEISIRGNQITVKDGFEKITGTMGSEEWQIQSFIMGQIHCILMEYTPAELINTVRKIANKQGK